MNFRRRRWLVREAKRASGVKSARFARLEMLRDSLASYRGMLAIGGCVGVLHLVALVPGPSVVATDDMRQYLFTLWQVAAALISLAFAIFVLVTQSLDRLRNDEYLWHRFQSTSLLYPAIALFLGTIGAISIGAIVVLPSDRFSTAPGLFWIFVLDVALVLSCLALIAWMYGQTFRLLGTAVIDRYVITCLAQAVRENLQRQLLARHAERILQQACLAQGFVYRRGNAREPGMFEYRMTRTGEIRDIELGVLQKIAALLPARQPHAAILTVGLGSHVSNGDVALLTFAQLPTGSEAVLQSAIRVRSE